MHRFIVFAALLLSLAGEARAQRPAYGMNLRAVTGPQADKMVELGATTARVVFGWDTIEPSCKGCFNWTITDAWRDEARRVNLSIFGTLAYTPRWANGGRTFNYPPDDFKDWYDFVHAVALRYKDDVFLWGVWNEPNLNTYLKDGDLRVYQALVVTARAAIKAANPNANVLGPEVSQHAFKEGWYAAAMRGFGDQFDIVTVHWYPDGPSLDYMMDQQVRPFAQGKPVWMTEAGMRACETIFGEAGQAVLYDRILRVFLPRRSWWSGVLFYDLYDPPEPLDCGSGIVRPDFSNRPAFLLYQSFIKANR